MAEDSVFKLPVSKFGHFGDLIEYVYRRVYILVYKFLKKGLS